jgi:hypothetical protein
VGSAPYHEYCSTFYDDPQSRSIRVKGNNATWIDHPGPRVFNEDGKSLTAHFGKWNFLMKAVNGKKECAVGFHVITNPGSDGLVRARWGKGLF